MMVRPPGTWRVVVLLAALSMRRLWNRLSSSVRRRKGRRGTPRKGGFGGVLLGLVGAVMLLQSLLLFSMFMGRLGAAARVAEAPPGTAMLVPEEVGRLLRRTQAEVVRARSSGDAFAERAAYTDLRSKLADRAEAGEAGPESPQQIERIAELFERRGLDAFPQPPPPGGLLPREGAWPAPSRALRGGLGIALLLLTLALLLTSLGTANQDLGRVEWSFEWLFTFPARTGSLLLAKVLEYAVINPFSWMTLFPLALTAYYAGGHRGAAWPLAIATTLYGNALLGAARLTVETWLRLRLPLDRVKSVQAACTVVGILAFYSVLYLVLRRDLPAWFCDAMPGAGAVLPWLPPCSPVWLMSSYASTAWTLAGLAAVGVAVPALLVAWMGGLLARGVMAEAGPYRAGPRRVVPVKFAGWPRGLLGKEVRLFLRDRNFLVQTAVVPLLVIGFQVVMNPSWMRAASKSFDHGAMVAFGIGAYAVLAGGLSVITSEGRALWLLYAMPVSIAYVLRQKVALWATVGTFYCASVLALLAAVAGGLRGDMLLPAGMALLGVPVYASIAAGLGVLGSKPLEVEVQRRVRSSTAFVYLLLVSLYSFGIYASQWWDKLAILVLCSTLAFGIWQKVGQRIPFLLDPTSAPPPAVGLGDGLVAALVFLELQRLGMLIAGAGGGEADPRATTIAFACAGVLVVLGALAVFGLRRVPHLLQRLGLVRPAAGRFGPLVALAVGVAAGATAAALGIAYLWYVETTPWLRELAEKAPQLGGAGGPWMCVLAVVAAPLFEEFLFRGLIYRGMRESMKVVPAALWSAALFAVVHPSPVSWPPVLAMGVLAALSLEATGLLAVPIAVHAVYNGVVVWYQLT